MTSLKLIYFEGCPNAKKAEKTLEAIGVQFQRVCQDALPADSPYKAYASPTLLMNETIIFGAATGADGGCSVDLPNGEALKKRILKATGKL